MISFSFFNQTDDDYRIVSRGLQAFPDKRSTGVGAFAGEACELFQAFVEKPLPMIDRRFSARTDRFGIFLYLLCLCLCLWGCFRNV